ncbi:ribosome maturation factor RimP [Quadrisphaera sp. DSM 44207]|nr:ribosome maturation factor RimP [Quadrisphaera sp. DSM 44207]SDQ76807.1 ribosome maturation factor RimP [Quadrisphaera sp. DSM 44207]
MSPTERVREVVEPAVVAAGLVLEGVTVTPAGRRRVVRVVVDLPDDAVGSLDLDHVAAVSRAVAAALDADDAALGGAPYVLEVTTPGVDRPLTARRHWSRARTRVVTTTAAGAEVTGRVVSVDELGVVLEVGGEQRAVPWADLGTGRVQVEFSRPGDDAADDTDDTDDDTDEDGAEDGEG